MRFACDLVMGHILVIRHTILDVVIRGNRIEIGMG